MAILLLALCAAWTAGSHDALRARHATRGAPPRTVPLAFEAVDTGRGDGHAYAARTGSYVALAEEGSVRFFLRAGDDTVEQVALRPMGPGLRQVAPGASAPGAGVAHYLLGNDPRRWRTNVTRYASVRYAGVYPGIDWVLHGSPQGLEYDFEVAPGADPGLIALRVEQAGSISANAAGDLVVDAGRASFSLSHPRCQQPSASGRPVPVECRFTLQPHRQQLGFSVARYDTRKPLTIDPVLVYSTHLGGTGDHFIAGRRDGDELDAIAVDANGNAYVAGTAWSIDFPTRNPLQAANLTSPKGSTNAVLAKFDPSGTTLVYATYLGGSSDPVASIGDYGTAVAIDQGGHAYLGGIACSPDFPTVNAFQAVHAPAAACSGFVARFAPSGQALDFSTLLGGPGRSDGQGADVVYALATDSTGAVVVAGSTNSSGFPVLHALQGTNRAAATGGHNGFIASFDPTGALRYSTYLGGSTGDQLDAIAVDAHDNVYVAGYSSSADFPVVNAFQATNHASAGALNAVAAKLAPDGSALLYATYIGGSGKGSGGDAAAAIAVNAAGELAIAGTARSTDFPLASPFQDRNAAAADPAGTTAFVLKLAAAGNALDFSTYLGGSGALGSSALDHGTGIAFDPQGNVLVAGASNSGDFPAVNGFVAPPASPGGQLPFVAAYTPHGERLLYAQLIPGDRGGSATSIAVDPAGNAYIAGYTYATDFPSLSPFQSANLAAPYGGQNGFVTKLSAAPAEGPPAPPRGVTAVPGDARVALAWQPSPSATRYDVYMGNTPGGEGTTPVMTSLGASATVQGLANGSTYYFRIAGESPAGIGLRSAEVSATPVASSGGGGGGSGGSGGGGGGAIDPVLLAALLVALAGRGAAAWRRAAAPQGRFR